jgi:hypothetical protein
MKSRNHQSMRGVAVLFVAATLGFAATAYAAAKFTPYPRMKAGSGQEVVKGGGMFGATRFVPKKVIVAWNGRTKHLNVYFLQTTTVDCSSLRRVISRPGRVVQAYITRNPFGVKVNRRVPHVMAEFLRYRTIQDPVQVAANDRGVTLVFTRVDTSPHGAIWNGRFRVKPFFQGSIYSYSGTFAANWCQIR